MTKAIDKMAFRQIMGCFTTGVAVVTARNEALGAFGVTINSLTSLSLDPPLLLFCLDKNAFLHKALGQADLFAINFLAKGQEDVSRYFADRHHNAKPKNLWDKPRQTCPVLRATLGSVVCRPYARHKGGDHTIFIGEVVDLHKRATVNEPLVYFHGRYRALTAATVTSGARK